MRKFTNREAAERYDARKAKREEKAEEQAETTAKLAALARVKASNKIDRPAFTVTTTEPNAEPREAANSKPAPKRAGSKPSDRCKPSSQRSKAKVRAHRLAKRANG